MEEKKIESTYVSEKKGRCIYAAPVARELIRRGYIITDIKPNKENHDKTVFIFGETDDFNSALEEVLVDYNEKKEKKAERRRLNEVMRKTFLERDYENPNKV